jgi:hypothetical protein
MQGLPEQEGIMSNIETIGRCDLCGVVDHHLIEGECPKCRLKACASLIDADSPRQFCVATTSRVHGKSNARVLIRRDSAGNKIISRVLHLGGTS